MLYKKGVFRVVFQAIAILLLHAFLVSNVAFAIPEANNFALAPPLTTNPPCEILYDKKTGTCDVVTNDDVIEAWDRETVRSYGQDVTASGKAFRNRWAFVDVSYLIAQMLILTQEHKFQNPKEILIPLIKRHIRNRGNMAEILLEGYDIERIEEVREGQAITGFYLPVTRNGSPAYRLVYNLQGGDAGFSMKDGTRIYVKTERDLTTAKTVKVTTPIDIASALSNPALREFIASAMDTCYKQFSVSQETIDGIIAILFSHYREGQDKIAKRLMDYIQNTDFEKIYQDYEREKSHKGRLGRIQGFIEGALVADIGCGAGEISEGIIKNVSGVKKVIATDIIQYHRITHPSVEFRLQSRGDRIPIESDTVDTVVLSYILHHIKENLQENFLQDTYRVLRDGGKVVILEDTYSDTLRPEQESKLLEKFLRLDDEEKKTVLAINDWLGNVVFRGLDMVLPFNYKSMEEWKRHFSVTNFAITHEQFLGTPKDSFHFAPRGIFVLEKVSAPRVSEKTATTSTGMSPESERIHATNLQDTINYIQAKEGKRVTKADEKTQPLIVALGTSWIKAYERYSDGKFRYLQGQNLNKLITSVTGLSSENGINFIVDEDEALLGRISEINGYENAKVVVMAGKDTVTSEDFKTLRDKEKNILVGVNNKHLSIDSYIRLVEMLNLTLKLASNMDVDMDNRNIDITPVKDAEGRILYYIFTPKAEPMDYEDLRAIYSLQIFA